MSYCLKQTLLSLDCSALKSRKNHLSAQVQRPDRQVSLLPTMFISAVYFSRGEDNHFISQISNYGICLHKRLHPTENFLACTQYSATILHNLIIWEITRKKIFVCSDSEHTCNCPTTRGSERSFCTTVFCANNRIKRSKHIKTRQCTMSSYNTFYSHHDSKHSWKKLVS